MAASPHPRRSSLCVCLRVPKPPRDTRHRPWGPPNPASPHPSSICRDPANGGPQVPGVGTRLWLSGDHSSPHPAAPEAQGAEAAAPDRTGPQRAASCAWRRGGGGAGVCALDPWGCPAWRFTPSCPPTAPGHRAPHGVNCLKPLAAGRGSPEPGDRGGACRWVGTLVHLSGDPGSRRGWVGARPAPVPCAMGRPCSFQ